MCPLYPNNDMQNNPFHYLQSMVSLCGHVIYFNTCTNLTLTVELSNECEYPHANFDVCPSLLFSHAASVVRSSRFRRDARAPDEDEEIWFSQDDDNEDDSSPQVSEILRSKIDSDIDHIHRLWENKKGECFVERSFTRMPHSVLICYRPSPFNA